jgi:hypothetical protein
MNTVTTLFTALFDKIEDTIELTDEHYNATEYLDGLVTIGAAKLEPLKIVKFVDRYGRKGIMLGTHLGNLVMLERYTNHLHEVYVTNIARRLSIYMHLTRETKIPTSGAVGLPAILMFFAQDTANASRFREDDESQARQALKSLSDSQIPVSEYIRLYTIAGEVDNIKDLLEDNN